MPEDDGLNKFVKEMSPAHKAEIKKTYRHTADYCTGIISALSITLLNWAFGLNVGALTLTITIMGGYSAEHSLTVQNKYFFVLLISIYFIGIALTSISALLEHKRFIQKGLQLEAAFKNFKANKIKGTTFKDHIYKSTLSYGNIPSVLKWLSYICFFVGLGFSTYVLLRM